MLVGLALAGLAQLGGCGFQPLYGPGSPAAGIAGRVAPSPVPGAAGFALTERLGERLGGEGPATHRLDVVLQLDQEGIAITPEDITTRFRVRGRAEYRLVPLGGGPAALEGEVEGFTGYSTPASSTASAFASRAAERDAEQRLARSLADEIVLELALAAGDWAGDRAE